MRVWLARLWSRQVALLAEPKRVERVYMSTQGGGGGGGGGRTRSRVRNYC